MSVCLSVALQILLVGLHIILGSEAIYLIDMDSWWKWNR